MILILAVGIGAYSNSFDVPFVFDDKNILVERSDIRSLTDLAGPRYFAYLTFALNYHFGGYDVTGYHIVNLIIHLLAALLVYALLCLTFKTPYFQNQGADPLPHSPAAGTGRLAWQLRTPQVFIPLLAALLFVAHPVQTQAITYIVQRMTSLAAFFYLLSLVLYVLARLALERKTGEPGFPLGPVLLLAAATIIALMGMKTKEIVFTLPIAIVLYEFFFFRGGWKRRLLCLLPLLATLPVVPVLVLASNETTGELLADVAEQTRELSGLSRMEYFFTQLRVIVTYLRLLILPINQNVDYDFPVYRSFFSAPVVASFLLLSGLAVLGGYLFVRTRRFPSDRRLSADPLGRLIAFGLFWFFLTLAVESSFIPIIDVIFEHRLYLPSVGAVLLLATGLFLLLRRFPGGERLLLPLAALWIVVLTVATFQRNHVWRDEIRLWQDVVAKSPAKGRPLNNLGVALEAAGRRPEAMAAMARAIQVSPDYHQAYYNLADLYLVGGQPEAALPLLESVIKLKPDFTEAYVKAGAALIRSRRFADAAVFLERNLDLVGGNGEARFYLGAAYAFTGNREAALRELEVVTRLAPALARDLAGLLGRGMVPHGR